jgi:hypothetical protein
MPESSFDLDSKVSAVGSCPALQGPLICSIESDGTLRRQGKIKEIQLYMQHDLTKKNASMPFRSIG